MKKYYSILFLSSFALFVFFLTPNVNTGDAGELATASYFLGVAHPSGYPLYLLMGKAVAFLPLGNMGFKVALLSAFFSSLSLTLLYWLIYKLTKNNTAAFFSSTILFVSYSYFTQSVIAKFYPLNLLIILVIFVLWVRSFLHEYDDRVAYMTAFLLGLASANHHTALFMLIPAILAMYMHGKIMQYRLFPVLASLFLLGFLINAYIFVRGGEAAFFNANTVLSFEGFWKFFLRFPYNKGGSIAAVGSTASNMVGYWYAMRNMLIILSKNFSLFSYPLFIVGAIWLYKKHGKIFAFSFLSLLLFGPFLAKVSFSAQSQTGEDYYLGAHQYFLPAFAFYVFFLGIGFYQIIQWLRKRNLKILQKALPVIFAFFPLVFVVSRATDSNYRTDYVPYQVARDMHSVLPPGSAFIAFGDNEAYQGWYIKLIGRFREDNCMMAVPHPQDTIWMMDGCNKRIYANIYPLVFQKSVNSMATYMVNMRFYGTSLITDEFVFNKYMRDRPFSLQHLYLPTSSLIKNIDQLDPIADKFLKERLVIADKLIYPQVCLSHLTDDNFTEALCERYFFHLLEMAKLFSGSQYGPAGITVNIDMYSKMLSRQDISYKILLTEKNRYYLDLVNRINKHNQWEILYTRKK